MSFLEERSIFLFLSQSKKIVDSEGSERCPKMAYFKTHPFSILMTLSKLRSPKTLHCLLRMTPL